MAVRAGMALYLAAAFVLLRSCRSLDLNETTIYPEDLNSTEITTSVNGSATTETSTIKESATEAETAPTEKATTAFQGFTHNPGTEKSHRELLSPSTGAAETSAAVTPAAETPAQTAPITRGPTSSTAEGEHYTITIAPVWRPLLGRVCGPFNRSGLFSRQMAALFGRFL